MNCPNCNKEILENAKFCGFCGSKIESSKMKNEKTKIISNDEVISNEEQDSTIEKNVKLEENLKKKSKDQVDELPNIKQKTIINTLKQEKTTEYQQTKKKPKIIKEENPTSTSLIDANEKDIKLEKTINEEKTNPNYTAPPSEAKTGINKTSILISAALGVITVIVVIVLMTVDFGETEKQAISTSPTEQEIWTKTINYNTIDAYQQYLKMFPQGEYAFDANVKIEQLKKKEVPNPEKKEPPVTISAEPNKKEASAIKPKKVKPKPQNESSNNKTTTSQKKNKQNTSTKSTTNNTTKTETKPTEAPKPTYTLIPSGNKKKETEDNKIYDVVDEMANYPAGVSGMMKFIANNIKYPMQATEKGIDGRVFISFIVEKNGSLENIRVLRGIGGGCDEEAIRVIKKMPKWKPAKLNHKKVRSTITIPIVFKLRKL